MQQTVIVIVILALVILVYLLCTGKKVKSPDKRSEEDDREGESASSRPSRLKNTELSTGFLPMLIMDQTTSKGMVIESFDIPSIPEEGITVSRPGAKAGDILLSSKGKDAQTVGTEGFIIGKDDNGMFGRLYDNGHKKNKLFLFNAETKELTETEQFDITDGTVICMGSQWLKFRIPTVPVIPTAFTEEKPVESPLVFHTAQRDEIPVQKQPVLREQHYETPAYTPAAAQKEPPVFTERPSTAVPPEKTAEEPKAPSRIPTAPSGFSFETTVDENGRFVIKK